MASFDHTNDAAFSVKTYVVKVIDSCSEANNASRRDFVFRYRKKSITPVSIILFQK